MYLTLHRAKRIAFATSVISMTILSACPLEYLPLWAYLPPSVSGNNKMKGSTFNPCIVTHVYYKRKLDDKDEDILNSSHF